MNNFGASTADERDGLNTAVQEDSPNSSKKNGRNTPISDRQAEVIR